RNERRHDERRAREGVGRAVSKRGVHRAAGVARDAPGWASAYPTGGFGAHFRINARARSSNPLGRGEPQGNWGERRRLRKTRQLACAAVAAGLAAAALRFSAWRRRMGAFWQRLRRFFLSGVASHSCRRRTFHFGVLAMRARKVPQNPDSVKVLGG